MKEQNASTTGTLKIGGWSCRSNLYVKYRTLDWELNKILEGTEIDGNRLFFPPLLKKKLCHCWKHSSILSAYLSDAKTFGHLLAPIRFRNLIERIYITYANIQDISREDYGTNMTFKYRQIVYFLPKLWKHRSKILRVCWRALMFNKSLTFLKKEHEKSLQIVSLEERLLVGKTELQQLLDLASK